MCWFTKCRLEILKKKQQLQKWKYTIKYSHECEIMFLMGNIWFRFWTWENINSFVSTATTKNKKLYILSFLQQKSFDPLFFDSNCSCLMCINKEDFLIKLFNHETIVPLQPFLLKLHLINHKLNEKNKLALRIRLNPDNRHKDQKHVIAKKIPVVSYCTDARVARLGM